MSPAARLAGLVAALLAAASLLPACAPVPPADQDGDGVLDDRDCSPDDPSVHPGAPEVCDGADQDCDQLVDEGIPTETVYADVDGDGFGVASTAAARCAPAEGEADRSGDCDDARADVYPGAPEACDGADHDCDGTIGDVPRGDGTEAYGFRDADGDGAGAEPVAGCPGDPGVSATSDDCDDGDPRVHPGAPETCAGRGVDEDCDGLVDDADPDVTDARPWYPDLDGDGYGAGATTARCEAGPGEVVDGDDCDDTRADVHPLAVEPDCTAGVDYDCDGTAVNQDRDADGADACADCDDLDATSLPGAPELCDELDNDCNGAVDDGVVVPTWYEDHDGDGYGDDGVFVTRCAEPPHSVLITGDCDDTNAAVSPSDVESCRTAYDDDCDGSINEEGAYACSTARYDADADGWGDATYGTRCLCAEDGDWQWISSSTSDCDDADATVHPNAAETCGDELDTDCDGYDGCTGADLPLVVAAAGTSDGLGQALSARTDLDGDGIEDLAVTVPKAAGDYGELRVYAGPIGEGMVSPEAVLNGSSSRSLGDGGMAVGDGDGDGWADLYVGALTAHDASWASVGGYVAEVRGPVPASGALLDLAAAMWVGEDSGSELGTVVAFVDDLDGDGGPDLLLADRYSAARPLGAVFLVSAAAEGEAEAASASTVIYSDSDASFGRSVAVGRDLDGDGVTDLVVQGYRGAYVWFGPVTGTVPTSTRSIGLARRDGAFLAFADDVDGDGLPDLYAQSTAGFSVYTGLTSTAYVDVGGEFTLALPIGRDDADARGALVDLDGDGALDLVSHSSSSPAEGELRLFPGPLVGSRVAEDATDVWSGDDSSADLGQDVDAAGDITGDGLDDLLIHSAGNGTVPTAAGELRILSLGP